MAVWKSERDKAIEELNWLLESILFKEELLASISAITHQHAMHPEDTDFQEEHFRTLVSQLEARLTEEGEHSTAQALQIILEANPVSTSNIDELRERGEAIVAFPSICELILDRVECGCHLACFREIDNFEQILFISNRLDKDWADIETFDGRTAVRAEIARTIRYCRKYFPHPDYEWTFRHTQSELSKIIKTDKASISRRLKTGDLLTESEQSSTRYRLDTLKMRERERYQEYMQQRKVD